LYLSVDRRTPASQAPPGGRRPWSFKHHPKRAAVGCSRLSDGALIVRELEEELIDLPANPALDDRLLAPANLA
jgi:hypothetical protein